MQRTKRGDLWVFESRQLTAAPLVHAFSTRTGGVSSGAWESLNLWYDSGDSLAHVVANRARLARALRIDPSSLSSALQVHGDRVVEVTEPFADRSIEADGLMTDRRSVFLAAGSADCVPVLLFDPRRPAVAAVHTGWKGLTLGTVRKAVERMREAYGSAPGEIRSGVGPSAGPCCYEVREDVARLFPGEFLRNLAGGRIHLDLWAATRAQLMEAGLAPGHVDTAELCTVCRSEDFFSYRRDGPETGGMLAVIGMRA
jgi:YfiH family protein